MVPLVRFALTVFTTWVTVFKTVAFQLASPQRVSLFLFTKIKSFSNFRSFLLLVTSFIILAFLPLSIYLFLNFAPLSF